MRRTIAVSALSITLLYGSCCLFPVPVEEHEGHEHEHHEHEEHEHHGPRIDVMDPAGPGNAAGEVDGAEQAAPRSGG